ncbi:MAG: hypothetical protein AAGG56_18365 [Pseudomonadota bacterium]
MALYFFDEGWELLDNVLDGLEVQRIDAFDLHVFIRLYIIASWYGLPRRAIGPDELRLAKAVAVLLGGVLRPAITVVHATRGAACAA